MVCNAREHLLAGFTGVTESRTAAKFSTYVPDASARRSQACHIPSVKATARFYGFTRNECRRSRDEWTIQDEMSGSQGMPLRAWKYSGSGGLMALVTAGALGLAACGGPTVPEVAGRGTTSTIVSSSASRTAPVSGSTQTQQLRFARCMRSKGISNFPDPSATGRQLQNILNAGINTQSTAYRSALRACRRFTPAAHLTPAENAADKAKGLEFSQCMRQHGVPNFPDPSAGPDGEQVINLNPAHIDPDSPTIQSADRACQKIVPGSK